MPKLTLLDLTQRILNDMNGDEVNSISDTLESQQVASIIRDSFQEIIAQRSWPHLNRLLTPTPLGAATPTHVTMADPWVFLKEVKYNKRNQTATKDRYDGVDYLEPGEFLELTNTRNSSATKTDVIADPESGRTLFILNDVAPTFWSTFDDETLIFDSYDSLVDTNLQASKFQVWGNYEPVWVHTDIAVPDLPAKAFPYLLAEAKSNAFNALMQVGNQKAEQQSRRQAVWLGREKWRGGQKQKFPDFGRKATK